MAAATPARAEPWLGRLEPQSLFGEMAAAGFVGGSTTACAPGRACLAEEPVAPVTQLSWYGGARLQVALLAEEMLGPAANSLLLVLRLEGRDLSYETLMQPARTLRLLKPLRNRALLRRLADPDFLQVAAMFVAGVTLFLASTVLGLAARGPSDPILPPNPESGQGQHLPSLLVSPFNPLGNRGS